ncbi:hypothetical protein HPP92_023960 [Vanilla planifolia]|uniref:Uncharacterized protein n=1 Tax=Vanilla planifolia TaxID=51239 RepID=A0A835PNT4_VANPL|nr:hypothetical protein HPP92_023960 [Vanilla planifolia]
MASDGSDRAREVKVKSSVFQKGSHCAPPGADKNLTPKQRRVHDGKRIDKKNFRSTVKNKYECLIPKTGLSCSDTLASGNTIADLHDFAKHLDELSLSQLLDGSYKYHKLTVEKGKKSSVTNDSILLSVRRACSILFPPTFSAAEKTNNLKESQSSQDPRFFMGSGSDCETKDHAESLLKPKAQNSFHENILGSTVLLPKKVVNQLTLRAPHELEVYC